MREFLFASIFSMKYEVKLLVESEGSAGDVGVIQREGVKCPFWRARGLARSTELKSYCESETSLADLFFSSKLSCLDVDIGKLS